MKGSLSEGFTTMIHLTYHMCGSELLVNSLETAERAGWARSSGGWICLSYDCYQSCTHRRLGLHQEATAQAREAAGLGVC